MLGAVHTALLASVHSIHRDTVKKVPADIPNRYRDGATALPQGRTEQTQSYLD